MDKNQPPLITSSTPTLKELLLSEDCRYEDGLPLPERGAFKRREPIDFNEESWHWENDEHLISK